MMTGPGLELSIKSPLNAGDLVSYVSFNINYFSHIEIIERGV